MALSDCNFMCACVQENKKKSLVNVSLFASIYQEAIQISNLDQYLNSQKDFTQLSRSLCLYSQLSHTTPQSLSLSLSFPP